MEFLSCMYMLLYPFIMAIFVVWVSDRMAKKDNPLDTIPEFILAFVFVVVLTIGVFAALAVSCGAMDNHHSHVKESR